MKKIIYTILLSLLSILSYAQSQKNIDGFWEIKLGMTIKELEKVVDVSLLMKDRGLDNFPLTEDNLAGRLEVYKLDEYVVSAEHCLEEIKLYFFDGKLYMIDVNEYNYDTEDFLTEKYGKPEADVKSRGFDKNLPYMKIYKVWMTNAPDQTTICMSTIYKNEQHEIDDYTLNLFDIATFVKVDNLIFEQYLDNIDN